MKRFHLEAGPSGRSSSVSPSPSPVPRLIVFDLDNTLWTPELYELWSAPKANRDICLFKGAEKVLAELLSDPKWKGTRAAAASRATRTGWANNLLDTFSVTVQKEGKSRQGSQEVPIGPLFPFREVYSGSKTAHLSQIQRQSGVSYSDMIFFDDWYENCDAVSSLGVFSVVVNDGIKEADWEEALREWERLKREQPNEMGCVWMRRRKQQNSRYW
uniref:Magnesium-dependent phosphatase-1 n=1 Tax=Chromera velia CCMP2878 TaxID=1169474 RepID=A0A0G4H0D9_9ALVE|eukprot:Cvel_24115.t1-p1 / transcript=Cvel_24115.t1 / gene=Cvel_24115 / organism=Chromera_velia_CCMP2878 / gene_product=Magnesium-dependent phosphatase 1, putative / transcript_product=Magnesium-dependent phosphatase 1, putative / location=Cvel_scaffold2569:904-3107(-) / protein_length=214 / sequence_SO=supercontig / SO=protein_coding / is_pseudo=false